MAGTNRHTGQEMTERDHITQSIIDILTTPIGTRVGRRDYGSNLHDLVDRPLSAGLVVDVAQASAEALKKDEPRVKLSRVFLETVSAGAMAFALEVTDTRGRFIIDGVQV